MSLRAQPVDEVPVLRGLLHAICCPLALVSGLVLAALAPSPRAAVALLLMCLGFAGIFGASGLYHRVRWSPVARRRARVADHSMIFVGTATTYTAIWLAALGDPLSDAVLAFCWIAAAVGVVSRIWLLDARRSRHWLGYCGFGLVGIVVLPQLWRTMGPGAVGLLVAGGLAFLLGGAAYAAGRPNPIPRWLGYHEVFHIGTIIGSACFLGALAQFTLA